MKKILLYILTAMAISVTSVACNSEQSKANDAEIEAAALEGRRAAKEFVTKQWKDTMQLQNLLLAVRAQQSKYELEGRKECAAAFDTAFVKTLRTVRPDIARHLKPITEAAPAEP